MVEILSRVELKQLRIEFHKVQKQKDNWSDYVAKAEQKHTLQQVVKKLDFLLQASPYKGITLRRSVGILAEELQKEANSE